MDNKRKNKKQLRVFEDNTRKAEASRRAYAVAFKKDVCWNTFGNLLIEKGVSALQKEMKDIQAEQEAFDGQTGVAPKCSV